MTARKKAADLHAQLTPAQQTCARRAWAIVHSELAAGSIATPTQIVARVTDDEPSRQLISDFIFALIEADMEMRDRDEMLKELREHIERKLSAS